jgi:hypothetical protein
MLHNLQLQVTADGFSRINGKPIKPLRILRHRRWNHEQSASPSNVVAAENQWIIYRHPAEEKSPSQ